VYVNNNPVNYVDLWGLEWERTGQFGQIYKFDNKDTYKHVGEDWKWVEDNENLTTGQPVPAVNPGTVKDVGERSDIGKYVRTKDKQGVRTDYFHLSDTSQVKKNDTINVGDTIGLGGSTGTASTGPHVHIAESTPQSQVPSGDYITKYGRNYTDPSDLDMAQQTADTAIARREIQERRAWKVLKGK